MAVVDPSRKCSIGLLTTEPFDDLGNFISHAEEQGHDFVITPISHPTFRRVLNEKGQMTKEQHAAWMNQPAFDRKDLVIRSAGTCCRQREYIDILTNPLL
jgi:protein arginine N-methyltransferase 5